MAHPPFILLEDRKSDPLLKNQRLFSCPVDEIVCWQPDELSHTLNRIDELRKQGYYLAGFISYEAGYFLDTPYVIDPAHVDFSHPLLHFFVFEDCTHLTAAEVDDYLSVLTQQTPKSVLINNLRLSLTKAEYVQAFNQVKKYIFSGDTYQVNLTARYQFDCHGSPVCLFQQLRNRQKVAYSALFHCNDYQILSFSPELFFCKTGTRMVVEPMKGTMPRHVDPKQDLNNKNFLTTDLKSIAENTMIVDLLRNDLCSISTVGSVKTVALLQVASFETVHQMTSTIESQVDEHLSFQTIIRRLFPCGSITGAPKRRTMQIIHALERLPRRLYTGAIGYLTPDNDMCFNVSIRTIFLKKTMGELGVGGGLVADSDAESEWNELQLKADFFTKMSGVRLAEERGRGS